MKDMHDDDMARSRVEKSLSRFLVFSMLVLLLYIPLNALNGAPVLAIIQGLVLLILPLLYIWLKQGGPIFWVKHGIGFSTLAILLPLLFNPSVEDTGIYWIFGYPLIVFFFLGVRTGIEWTAAYFMCLGLGVLLAYFDIIHLYYAYTQVAISMLELLFFSVISYFFVRDNEQAELKMRSHLRYLQSIDRIEMASHADMAIDESMHTVLQVLLDDFQASRAWLLYPCNPDGDTWSVPFECSVPAFPGAFEKGGEYPVDDDARQVFMAALAEDSPVCYGKDNPVPGQKEVLKMFSIRSQMVVALYPETNHAWLLGIHQCDNERDYSEHEQRLFRAAARRIGDALNQKLLYRDLQEASKQAEAANHAKSEFLSVMSHELRTPLHGIIGLQSLIAADQDNLNQEQQEHLMLAQQAAHSLQELVNDVLSLSKVESGTVELIHEVFLLKDCLLKTVAPFVITCREKGISLNICLQDVPVSVVGDEVRLRQILVNLIGNAVKFTDQGSVDVRVCEEEKMLLFAVQDTGIGIQEALLLRIFEPFLQEVALMDGNHQGTGLGTTIAKRFVELMGGKIQAKSVLGEGSCFEFQLPYQAHGQQKVVWQEDITQLRLGLYDAGVEQPLHQGDMDKRCVLLAEDDPIAQRIAEKRFKRANIKLDIAADGLEAWEKVQLHDYDLLLSDIRMPGLDGMQLAKKIRQREKACNLKMLPIVGLSAHAVDEVVNECYAAGMNAFMAKPIDPDQVLLTLQSLMQELKSARN